MSARALSMRLLVLAAALLAMPTAWGDDLAQGFARPPDSARPWVYWFWLNGNITREGITADLEAMRRVGIGGVLIMEVDQGAPLGPVPFASEEWRQLFRHVVSEADRLGLEVNMNNDAGWCGSGGPWMTPDLAMQQLVGSEIEVTGPATVDQVLPMPPTVAGYYRDVAVIAFPTPTPSDYRIPDTHGKAAFVRRDLPPVATFEVLPPEQTVPRERVMDISDHMTADGRLRWEAPQGRWTILRFGHTPTGSVNAPSPESGRGLECDKLSKEATEAHFQAFIGKLIEDNGRLSGRTFVATHIDSWETGSQNWTPRFREEFMRLRGYDPMPYMPVVFGRVVDSYEVAERFLYDLRQTVSDLLLENYAGHMRELARRHGLHLTIEAYGDTTVDNIAYAGRADEPMGEFWSWPSYGAAGTLVEMASGAHIYGRPIVGAEAFTAGDGERWLYHPGYIKAMGDWAFCLGINRFVFHRYALQPWHDRRPGMSMGPWGLHYERTQTWWEQSGPWHEYLSRCQFLLQRGLPVVDILCLAPEGAPRSFNPPPSLNRTGYKADVCSTEALLTRVQARDGRLVLPDGMSYRILALPGAEAMTPELLKKLAELARGGATIVGAPPKKAPGLTGYPQCDAEVRALVDDLWGKGRVIADKAPDKLLSERGLPPDFSSDRVLDFVHRKIGDTDVYFVSNQSGHGVNATCEFRIASGEPELWDPETGETAPAASWVRSGGLTRVWLRLEASESVFVVFRPGGRANDSVVSISRDGAVVWPTPSRDVKVVVRRALWGPAADPQRTKDVTDQVQRMLDRGVQSFQVAELASEGDPAYGVVKTLTVDYEVGGVAHTASATDPEMITFDLPADAPPPVEVQRASGGRLVAIGAEGGSYTARTASGRTATFQLPHPRTVELAGPWELRFPHGWGAPERVTLDRLASWSDHPDQGVRYFSGTGTYRKSVNVPASLLAPGRRVTLDLGRVEVMARVSLNGTDLGILWKPPYRVDITKVARPGENHLVVAVTNLWPNRMIGDEELPEDSLRHGNGTLREWPAWLATDEPSPTGRFTFTSWRLWRKGEQLLPSGLLGPVRVVSEDTRTIGQ